MNEEAIIVTKKRNPIWAALLSVLTPGLGHVYAGDLKKGLSLIGIEYGVILVAGIAGVLSTFYGIAALIVFFIGFYIFVIISSVRLALKNRQYPLQPYNRWYWYLAILMAVSLIANTLFSARGAILGYQTYQIPSRAMEPTLQAGDFITVNTRYHQPKVGDVIVFLYPKDRRILYVKRVAAVGDDTVSIHDGVVYRNGKPEPSLAVPEERRVRDISVSMNERRIPENELFVLGDWRDNSSDSRFWGTVPVNDVIGQVTQIWFADDTSRIGKTVK
ncbi:signal peptidase I [Vibrio gazogenes]|nr:signal peptidase I [Vibrio gazogenes]